MRNDGNGQGQSTRRRLRTATAVGLVASSLLAAYPATLAAADRDMLELRGLRPLSESDLSGLRGGFSVGPFLVNFGFKIQTIVNNVPVVQTSFNVVNPNQLSDVKIEVKVPKVEPVKVNVDVVDLGLDADDLDEATDQGVQITSDPGQPIRQYVDAPPPPDIQVDADASELPEVPVAQFDSTSNNASNDASASPVAGSDANATPQPPLPGEIAVASESDADSIPAIANAISDTGGAEGGSVVAVGAEPDTRTQTFTLDDLRNGISITVDGTQIMQRLGNGVVTEILNQADNQSIQHSTEINLFIPNFSEVVSQAQMRIGLSNLALETVRLGLNTGN